MLKELRNGEGERDQMGPRDGTEEAGMRYIRSVDIAVGPNVAPWIEF